MTAGTVSSATRPRARPASSCSPRQILNVVFGAGGANAFFQEYNARLPLKPAAVHEQAMVVSGKLLDEDFVPPPVRYEVGVDLRAIGRKLREPAERLGAALAKLDLGLHGKNQPLEAKERLFAQLHKRALQGAQLLEAIYNYSGHEGIASRTRQSRHRLRRNVMVAEPPPPAGGGPEPWSAASRARSPAVPATTAGRSPPDHERRAIVGGIRRAPADRLAL